MPNTIMVGIVINVTINNVETKPVINENCVSAIDDANKRDVIMITQTRTIDTGIANLLIFEANKNPFNILKNKNVIKDITRFL